MEDIQDLERVCKNGENSVFFVGFLDPDFSKIEVGVDTLQIDESEDFITYLVKREVTRGIEDDLNNKEEHSKVSFVNGILLVMKLLDLMKGDDLELRFRTKEESCY